MYITNRQLNAIALMIAVFLIGPVVVSAWTGAPGAPTNCPLTTEGCNAPVNTGSTNQVKSGGLAVGGNLTTGGNLTLLGITGATQCLTVNSSGIVSGTGQACGTGTGGITNFVLNTAGGITGGTTVNTSGQTVNLNIDNTIIQKRVTGTCAAGSSIRVINSDGSVACQTDTNSGGTLTGITQGAGISVSGGAPSPTVTNTGVTSLSAGSGISLSGSTGAVTISASGGGSVTGATNGSNTTGYLSGSNVKVDLNNTVSISGSMTASGFFYSSDRNLKKNIAPLNDSLNKILDLQGVSFNWRNSGKPSIGLIAQDVEKIYPDLVATDPKTGLKSVEYANLIAPLIEAVKAQQKEIEALKAEVKALKK